MGTGSGSTGTKMLKIVGQKKLRKGRSTHFDWFIQGPLITDGRNSNEMGFSKISLGRMTLAFQKNEDITTKFK